MKRLINTFNTIAINLALILAYYWFLQWLAHYTH
jgi:hypothetical protein